MVIQTWYEALVERPEDSQSRYRLSIIIISGVKSKEDHFSNINLSNINTLIGLYN